MSGGMGNLSTSGQHQLGSQGEVSVKTPKLDSFYILV